MPPKKIQQVLFSRKKMIQQLFQTKFQCYLPVQNLLYNPYAVDAVKECSNFDQLKKKFDQLNSGSTQLSYFLEKAYLMRFTSKRFQTAIKAQMQKLDPQIQWKAIHTILHKYCTSHQIEMNLKVDPDYVGLLKFRQKSHAPNELNLTKTKIIKKRVNKNKSTVRFAKTVINHERTIQRKEIY